ncbi:MAG TPA: hypothetical protein VLH56_14535 [Dissulfurispiraceae bacterium]|nr:hypothetical protein [Dissulfurispiraceae bacterium]
MKSVICETNVIAVANECATQAGPDCVTACIDALEEARRKNRVAIDAGMFFFEEYFRHARRSGQPGAGDAFVKWLWDNQANVKRCERVTITPLPDEPDCFTEFPDDPALRCFDRNDRKFVAVATASKHKPKILNASDTDWWHYREALQANGVKINFLCPELMSGKRGCRDTKRASR